MLSPSCLIDGRGKFAELSPLKASFEVTQEPCTDTSLYQAFLGSFQEEIVFPRLLYQVVHLNNQS